MRAGPDHSNHTLARLVLQRVEHALSGRREVGGLLRRIFLEHDLHVRTNLRERILHRLHAITAESIILRQGGDADFAARREGGSAGNRVLRRIAAGAEDVAVPLFAGDRIGHGELDDQDLLVLLGDRQHGERAARTSGTHGQIDIVVGIGLFQ